MESLKHEAESVRSQEGMSAISKRLSVTIKLVPAHGHSKIGVPYIDNFANAAGRKQALTRLQQVFATLKPKVELVGVSGGLPAEEDPMSFQFHPGNSKPARPPTVEPLSLVRHLYQKVLERREEAKVEEKDQLEEQEEKSVVEAGDKK